MAIAFTFAAYPNRSTVHIKEVRSRFHRDTIGSRSLSGYAGVHWGRGWYIPTSRARLARGRNVRVRRWYIIVYPDKSGTKSGHPRLLKKDRGVSLVNRDYVSPGTSRPIGALCKSPFDTFFSRFHTFPVYSFGWVVKK